MEIKCIAPRRMVNVMKEFLEQANNITYIADTLKPIPEGIDFWDWMNNSENWESIEYRCSIRINKNVKDNCCAYLSEYFEEDETTLHIGYNKNLKENPYQNNYFTANFRRRCPIAKGFTGITLSLLHELGHFATDEQCRKENPNYNRGMAIFEAQLRAKTDKELNEKYYFRLPDETYATEWAIEWLKDAEHRKIAKAFEKKFFNCFEKRA